MASARTTGGRLHIPTVDITAFRDTDATEYDRDTVAAQIDRAARTVGFMQIIGHAIDEQTLTDFTAATDAFFALDAATKMTYRCPPSVNRGYSPPKSEALATSLGLITPADLFESFNIGTQARDFPEVVLPHEDYPDNIWPAEIPGFAAAVQAWFDAAGGVARTLVRAFGRALGVGDDGLTAFTTHSIDTLRMVNYRLPSADMAVEPNQLGMGAHTDYGIVTVLWADQVPGLEVLGSEGMWHPVQPAPGALLVNLGDALARWTNEQWISTMHRVAAPVVGGVLVPRRSAAFFHDGNVDAVIAALPSCIDAGSPAVYEPVTVGEHLRAKLAGSRSQVPVAGAEREAARLASR